MNIKLLLFTRNLQCCFRA